MTVDRHSRRPEPAGPQVGADEWVARQAHRREYLPCWLGTAQQPAERVGWWPRLAIAGLAGGRAAAARPRRLPAAGRDRRAGDRAAGASGLNIVVGWAGLLDLGYVAFFGFGAYGFALLSSGAARSGRHPPAGLPVAADRDDRRRDPRAAGRLAVPAADRRLPGDRHPVLRRGVRRVHQQRGARRAGRPQRDRRASTRSAASGIQVTSNTGYYYLLLVLLVRRRWRCCGCSTTRAPGGPGGPCARTRWRRRR